MTRYRLIAVLGSIALFALVLIIGQWQATSGRIWIGLAAQIALVGAYMYVCRRADPRR